MAKPMITTAGAKAILDGLMPGASGLHPLAEGDDSRAFGFRQGDEAFVLRLNRDAAGYEKDAFVQRRFAGPALPIPDILHLVQVDGLAACISRRAPGMTLQDLEGAALDAAVPPTAAVMAAIAASDLARTEGFGRFGADGRGIRASWREVLEEPFHLDWAGSSVHTGLIGRILDGIRVLAPHCPEDRGLVHGDFGSNNVLVADSRITAVIDWSEAMFGDPLYDVANILFWRPWLACMERQARYFETQTPPPPAIRDRLLCYQLHIGVRELHEAARAGDDADLAWASGRCAGLLDP